MFSDLFLPQEDNTVIIHWKFLGLPAINWSFSDRPLTLSQPSYLYVSRTKVKPTPCCMQTAKARARLRGSAQSGPGLRSSLLRFFGIHLLWMWAAHALTWYRGWAYWMAHRFSHMTKRVTVFRPSCALVYAVSSDELICRPFHCHELYWRLGIFLWKHVHVTVYQIQRTQNRRRF